MAICHLEADMNANWIERKSLKLFGLLVILSLFFLSNTPAFSQLTAPIWPHEKSDLLPDSSLVFGKLPNGFRYVLMENKYPENRVSMHLNVQSGSLNEKSSQQGLAHFLEHMLFDGSVHFPPGELVKYFQRIGMQFGPDANAHTGFSETVYDILLPDGSTQSIDDGFLVLQDYAQGALLLEEEVEKERRVILSEKRSRDSASYRTFIETLKFEFPDARISKRLPIGTEEVIQKADRSLLKSYYDTWYRPDNMILVMVGDFEAAKTVPLIEKKFAGLTARAPRQADAEFGAIDHRGVKTFYHYEQEAGKANVSIEVIEKVPAQSDSLALQKLLLTRYLADRIIQNRLDKLIRKPGTPFTGASISSGLFLKQAKIAGIEAECEPEKWKPSLTMLNQILRQALEYGFSKAELERVRKEFLAELDNNVQQAATRESQKLARDIIRHINADRVFMSPGQEKAIFSPFIQALTPNDLHREFRKLWSPNHRLVLATGNVKVSETGKTPPESILSQYLASEKLPVNPPDQVRMVQFPYLPAPVQKGAIIRSVKQEDIDITQIDFQNGVCLNLKPTDFKRDQVLVKVIFGSGRSSQPLEHAGLADLAAEVINESGLGGLESVELERALAGKSTDVVFGISEDHFYFKGQTIKKEMELLFQLLYAHFTDLAIRPQAFDLTMQRFKQRYKELSTSIDGSLILHGRRFLAGGDPRFGLPVIDEFGKLTLDHIRSWILPALDNAEVEISIVGDFDAETAAELTRTYIGSLPLRKGPPQPAMTTGPIFPETRSIEIRPETQIPKGLVVVAYPTEDLWNIHRTRRLNVLADIFSDKMRERIREKLGASYSPFAFNRPSRAYKDYGVFQTFVHVDPQETDAVLGEIKFIASDLAREGISPEDLARALKPTLTSIKDMLRTNGYWLETVLSGSKKHPEQLAWNRSIAADYAAITAEELSDLAKAYLINEKAAAIVVMPKNAQP